MKEFLNRFNLTLIIVCYSAIVLALHEQLHIYVVLFGALCALLRGTHFLGWISLMPRLQLSVVATATSVLTVGMLYQQGVFIPTAFNL
jgi:hypothetical protein